MSEILVITCPSGKQCSHLIPQVYDKGQFQLRLAAQSESSAAKLKEKYPKAEVVVVELTSLPSCQDLVAGASVIYHVGPSLHSRELEMGLNMIDATVSASPRPRHFVLSTVAGTQIRYLMQHDLKCRVEERLYLSPINWTILQPSNFMDAYPVAELAAQDEPHFEYRWNPDMQNSLVALRDLGEAAAKVLHEGEKHYFAQYQLTSTMPRSDGDVIRIIEQIIKKDIKARVVPLEAATQSVLGWLFAKELDSSQGSLPTAAANTGDIRPDITQDEMERIVLFSNRRGLRVSPNIMRWLLGREPTSVEEWVRLELNK